MQDKLKTVYPAYSFQGMKSEREKKTSISMSMVEEKAPSFTLGSPHY